MKRTILFALASIMLMGCGNQCKEQCNDCKAMKQQAVIENIQTRVSVRQFTGEKISQDQITTLLQCAMAAPSAINKQPWAFIVIDDEI